MPASSGSRVRFLKLGLSLAFALSALFPSVGRANVPVVSAAQLAAAANASAVIGSWGFEEGGGSTATDSSGNGHHGMLSGGASRTAGRFGDALELNGTTAHVALGNFDVSGTGLTISLWFRADDFDSADGRLLSKATGDSEADTWWMLSTALGPMPRFRLKTSTGTTTLLPTHPTIVASGGGPVRFWTDSAIVPGEWMHVAGTYDGATMRLYLNGVEIGSIAKTGAIATDPAVPVWIGRSPSSTQPFDGAIDEVRIHDRALSPAEIIAEMRSAIVSNASDTTSPTTPTALAATKVGTTTITLAWEASTDNHGVAFYRVFRDGSPVGETVFPEFTDSALAQGTTFSYRVRALDDAENESALSAALAVQTRTNPSGPTIDVWYGSSQRFGDIGMPQPWVNILGKVRVPPGRTVSSLNYRLNGGSPISLNVGPFPTSPRRIYHPGDFNADIATLALLPGANSVLITLFDSSGAMEQTTVNLSYDPTPVWPLPSVTNWSDSVPLYELCQPVDGHWGVQGSHLRPLELGYDRLVAIGDSEWTNYEVTVPITILGVDPNGYVFPSVNPAVGFLLRWPGHTPNGSQPHWAFQPLGALTWYEFDAGGNHRLEVVGNVGLNTVARTKQLYFGERYWFKARVENNASDPLYSFKVWRDGTTEPATWDVQNPEGASDPQKGCLLLVSHHVDALFGTVTVTAIGANPPQILTHPQSQTKCSGSEVTFSVTATGAGPLSYQWKKGETNVGTNSPSLVLTNVGASDAGSYRCVVSNPNGSAQSNVATLTIDSPVSFTSHPSNANPCVGSPLSLSVVATGGSLSYQWLQNGVPISGATSATYAKASVTALDGGTYRCDVTNACGTVSSQNATVTVRTPVSITTQPQSTAACPGEPLVLSVVANGTGPLSYAWTRNGAPVGGNSSTLTLSPADAGDAGSYQVTVTGACGSIQSSTAVVTIEEPVSIAVDPIPQSAPIGGSASFTVEADGTEPFFYQWKKNGGVIPGATQATFTIVSVTAGDAGSYSCEVSNGCNSVESDAATLTIGSGPTISAHPQSLSRCVGGSATFNVTATGTGTLSYSWRKDGVPIPGATSSSLTLSSLIVTDAGVYDVVVTDNVGSATSAPASLSIGTPPQIVAEPQGTSVCEGESFALSVTATSGASSWWNSAWSYRLPITISAGAHARTERPVTVEIDLTEALADAGGSGAIDLDSIRVIEVNAAGQILAANVPFQLDPGPGFNPTSNAVGTLVVLLRGTTPAGSQRRFHVYFDVEGSGFTPPVVEPLVSVSSEIDEGQDSFRIDTEIGTWWYHKQGAGFSSLDDVDGNDWISYSTATGSAGEFRGIPNLTFPTGHFHPGSTTGVSTLISQGPLRAKIRSETTNGLFTVEWEIFPRHATMTVLEAGSSYWFLYEGTPGGTLETGSDFVVRSNGTQTLASVTWGGDLVGEEWVYFGDPTVGRSLFVAHHGDDAAHDSYRPMDGLMTVFGFGRQSTTSLLTAVPNRFTVGLIDGTQFSPTAALIRSAYVDVATSVGEGESRATAGEVALSYQWQRNGSNIPGANGSTYSVASASASDNGNYRVIVTSPCGTATSAVAAVSVTAGPTITTQPSSKDVCEGTSTSFTVAATGTGLVYQWRRNGVNLPGANGSTLAISNVAQANAGSYDVVVSASCGSVTSATATLTVKKATSITTQPASQGVCPGDPVTFAVVADGVSLSYQWRRNGANIPGATGPSHTIASAAEAHEGNYTVVVSGDCGNVTSSVATLTVGAGPTITSQPSSTQACPGDSASFTVVASGTGLGYQWRKGGAPISGATSSTFSIASVTASDAGSYDVVVTSDCGAVTSAVATLTVGGSITITTQPSSQTICAGASASFTVVASGSGLTYQWRKNGAPIPGATSSSYMIPSVAAGDGGVYSVVVSNACASTTSAGATLTVGSPAAIVTEPADDTVCSGGVATLSVEATGTGLGYQWRRGGSPITGATSPTLTIDPALPEHTGSYDVVVTSDCGTVVSRTAALNVSSAPVITSHPQSQSVCPGESPILQVTATGLGLTYRWEKDGTEIPGASDAIYALGSVSPDDAGEYRAIVSNDCGEVASTAALLEVRPGPDILVPPESQFVCEGDPAAFTVEASSSGLSFQWRKDGTPIPGAISATYEIAAVSAADVGEYDVLITNACGSLRSPAAQLDLIEGPEIISEPEPRSACLGDAVAFSVSVTNAENATYEWRRDGAPIPGASGPVLEIASVSPADAGAYQVLISTSCGSIASSIAELTISVGCGIAFLRGDGNQDGTIDISDPITILNYLFRGGVEITCLSALDANDDGSLDIAEAIFLLGYLFRGGESPPPPNILTGCGIDPTPDDLGCESSFCL